MASDCLSCHMHSSLLLFVTHCSHGFSWASSYQVPTTLFSCPTESFLSHRISKHCSIPFPVIQANQPKSSFTYCIPQRSTIVSAIRFLYDCDNLCHPPWCGSWYLSTSRPPSTKEATEQRDLLFKQKHKMAANVSHGRGGKVANH